MRDFMLKLYTWAEAHKSREEGQGVIEYALVVGLVSVVLAGILATAGTGWIDAVGSLVSSKIAAVS